MKTFKRGGVHPSEHKDLTANKKLETIPVPELLYVPVSQHIGAPATLKVKAGDDVLKGQVIAEASGFVSVNIHSTVSGRVKSIEKINNLLAKPIDHVVIENDHQENWCPTCLSKSADWEKFSIDEMRQKIQDAGIVGMGGAAFPTHVKLNPPKDKKIDTLVINGAECEPYLTCDHRMMVEKAAGIASGIRILKKILGCDRVVVGIEANKTEAFKNMRAALSSDEGVEVRLLKVKYPQGAEKQLIVSVLGREVPVGGLPMDVGVVVQNVATCYAVYEAIAMNKPLIERAVTVSGDGVENPGNFIVRVGTPISFLLEYAKIKSKVKKVIAGGPMMGISIFNIDLPVLRGTSGIVVFSKVPDFIPGPCIRCGRCVQVCPLGGLASEIARAVEAGQQEEYKGLHALDCMECGSCTFVCPAHRPLVQYIKQAKYELAMKKQNKK